MSQLHFGHWAWKSGQIMQQDKAVLVASMDNSNLKIIPCSSKVLRNKRDGFVKTWVLICISIDVCVCMNINICVHN